MKRPVRKPRLPLAPDHPNYAIDQLHRYQKSMQEVLWCWQPLVLERGSWVSPVPVPPAE